MEIEALYPEEQEMIKKRYPVLFEEGHPLSIN
jgi:hypothetical protein